MLDLKTLTSNYLEYCRYQKNLNFKTLKAYTIDLNQFSKFMNSACNELNRANLLNYITLLHKAYKPKSIKRKIASIKAFCSYLEYEEIIEENPFAKIRVKFQEPFLLPKTIPINIIQLLLSSAYKSLLLQKEGGSEYRHNTILRDIAVLELLFATGIRVSELCSLTNNDVDLFEGTVKIYGKGSKERIVQIGNPAVLAALRNYRNAFEGKLVEIEYFFINRLQSRLSEQSVRMMIDKYVNMAGISNHITPRMFRHPYVKYTPKNNLSFFRMCMCSECVEEESSYFNPYNLSIAFLVINHTLPLFR